MKTRALLSMIAILGGLAILSSCGAKTEEEKIADLEKKIRKQESNIRKTQAKISGYRQEIAVLGGDTIQEPDIIPITTMEVLRKDFETFVEVPASVVSKDDVMVSSDLGGPVVRLLVDEGDYVRAGQLVAELDGQLVRSNIAEVEQSLELAKTVFEKRQRLWDQNIGSEIEYLQAKNNVESLEKTIATLNTQLSKLRITSPISGVVDAVMIESGEMAGPGMPVVRVVSLSRMLVRANVPEVYVGKVSKGDRVTVDLPAINKEITARVTTIGQTINPNNRTFLLEVDVPNADKMLKPNLVGTIKIRDEFIEDQVVIPGRLVQNSYTGDFVYTLDNENQVVQRKAIKTGAAANGEMVIVSGLDAGETLVDDGFRNVSDGSMVTVATAELN